MMKNAKWLMFVFACMAMSILTVAIHAAQAMDSTVSQARAYADPMRDYFFYVCVHKYFKGDTLDKLDISPGYALDYPSIDPRKVSAIADAAKQVADEIRTKQRPGAEVSEGAYDKAAVLAICLEKSRAYKIQ